MKKTHSTWESINAVMTRQYEFKDFLSAMQFVNDVAALAEKHNHHPDIDIRWNKVTLTLTTHDAGGVTEKDISLAKEIDKIKPLAPAREGM